MRIFELHNISFQYPDGTPGLSGVSLFLNQGECLGVVGPNGSGKSTLLKILAGLYFPQEGEILYMGERLSEERFKEKPFRESFRRKVAILFQNPESQILFPTVWQEVLFGPEQLKMDQKEAENRATAILRFFHIAHLKERHPYKLSGGEKKKVILASLLILDPEILLLDEPTDNLDPRSASELTSYLSGLSSAKTILLSTHDLNLVSKICSRVYLLSEEKKVAAEGRPEGLLKDKGLLEKLNLAEVD
ncbi:MAG: ABC transporter ATP-binding protein [Coprothermobacterota bacterium]|nr:ABC transporter ATP-binding protein [Coprothermobacterota bacterium]